MPFSYYYADVISPPPRELLYSRRRHAVRLMRCRAAALFLLRDGCRRRAIRDAIFEAAFRGRRDGDMMIFASDYSCTRYLRDMRFLGRRDERDARRKEAPFISAPFFD